MSENNELTATEVRNVLQKATNPANLHVDYEPVDWRQLKEAIDPDGTSLKAAELVDTPIILHHIKPFESSFDNQEEAFWVKGVIEQTGELFNTVIGGEACVEVLKGFYRASFELNQALTMGDDQRAQELQSIGAGRPVRLTLKSNQGGKYGRYYTFE